jgi:hypothetical protein
VFDGSSRMNGSRTHRRNGHNCIPLSRTLLFYPKHRMPILASCHISAAALPTRSHKPAHRRPRVNRSATVAPARPLPHARLLVPQRKAMPFCLPRASPFRASEQCVIWRNWIPAVRHRGGRVDANRWPPSRELKSCEGPTPGSPPRWAILTLGSAPPQACAVLEKN